MILLTGQPVHVGPNLVMVFSVLTFSQNWIRTHNVCYTFRLFIIVSAWWSITCLINWQRQSPRGILSKMCSENMQQIYRKTPMPKCYFNKVALQLYWNHTRHGCSPVNLQRIFRTPFTKNTSGQLPLRTLLLLN